VTTLIYLYLPSGQVDILKDCTDIVIGRGACEDPMVPPAGVLAFTDRTGKRCNTSLPFTLTVEPVFTEASKEDKI
jgi:hypothetical protein